jgi:hypothetical protein
MTNSNQPSFSVKSAFFATGLVLTNTIDPAIITEETISVSDMSKTVAKTGKQIGKSSERLIKIPAKIKAVWAKIYNNLVVNGQVSQTAIIDEMERLKSLQEPDSIEDKAYTYLIGLLYSLHDEMKRVSKNIASNKCNMFKKMPAGEFFKTFNFAKIESSDDESEEDAQDKYTEAQNAQLWEHFRKTYPTLSHARGNRSGISQEVRENLKKSKIESAKLVDVSELE